jgi:hypothetical protein
MDAEIDTFNKHMVGVQGGNIVVLMPPHGPMTKQEAMVFAAWLVTLADTTSNSRRFWPLFSPDRG